MFTVDSAWHSDPSVAAVEWEAVCCAVSKKPSDKRSSSLSVSTLLRATILELPS